MFFFRDAQSDYAGYSTIAWFNSYATSSKEKLIQVECSKLSWLDANLAAPMGAVIRSHAVKDGKSFQFHNMVPAVRSILCDMGLVTGTKRVGRNTVIPLQHFMPGQSEEFANYSKSHLEGKGIPSMSNELRKHFYLGIDEVFQNAEIHSESEHGLFACGQLYPKKNKLDFCVSDMGLGIPDVVRKGTAQKMASAEAIEWAMSGSNTTRKGDVPGGLGLKILKEFIRLNGGRLIVVSDDGYWEMSSEGFSRRELPASLPGTAVTIEVNTADRSSYRLTSEINPAELF